MDLLSLNPSDPAYWTAIRKAPPAEWPEADPDPVHTSRDPWPESFEIPRAVSTLRAALLGEGFEVRLTYARGFLRAQKIGTYNENQSVAVRFQGYGRIGYAVYRTPIGKRDWKWDGIAVSRPDDFPFYWCSRTDLTEWILAHGDLKPFWYKGIVARVADQKERQKQAAKNRTTTKESGG